MTVKETLKHSLILYPSINTNKWDVYHHLFIVNGNGYEWTDGELVCNSDKKDLTIEEAVDKHFEFYLSDKELLKNPLSYAVNQCKKNILDTLNWKERSEDFTKPNRRDNIYPLCKYAKILNIPENIKEDWKEAAQEIYEWLCINYNELGESNQKWIDKIKL